MSLNSLPSGLGDDRFRLQYPQSLGEFDDYESAQRAVDYLSDHEFPVENLMIVGTGLKLVERVVGRRTWGRVLGQGALSGVGTGLLVGIMLVLFMGVENPLLMMVAGLVMGVLMGLLTAGLGYSLTQGKRDFESMSSTIATRYEVLVEHKVALQARELLASMPGFRAGLFE